MKIKSANQVTSVTLVSYFGDFPMKRGNCFSVSTDDGNFKILNFNHENLEKLLSDNIISWPIKISPLSNSHAIVCDYRIPNEWYSERLCEVCTPFDLLPLPQKLKRFLEIERGNRTETDIEINGQKMKLVSIKVDSKVNYR